MIVSTLVVLVDEGLNPAVMPLGSPEIASDTVPVKPPAPVTLMVLEVDALSAIERLEEEAESVKPGAETVTLTTVELLKLPAVPLTVRE